MYDGGTALNPFLFSDFTVKFLHVRFEGVQCMLSMLTNMVNHKCYRLVMICRRTNITGKHLWSMHVSKVEHISITVLLEVLKKGMKRRAKHEISQTNNHMYILVLFLYSCLGVVLVVSLANLLSNGNGSRILGMWRCIGSLRGKYM